MRHRAWQRCCAKGHLQTPVGVWWVVGHPWEQSRENIGKLAFPFWHLVLPASPNWAFPPACAEAVLRLHSCTPGPWSLPPQQRNPAPSSGVEHCGLHGQGFQTWVSVLISSPPPKADPSVPLRESAWGESAASALSGTGSVSGHSIQICKRDTSSPLGLTIIIWSFYPFNLLINPWKGYLLRCNSPGKVKAEWRSPASHWASSFS